MQKVEYLLTLPKETSVDYVTLTKAIDNIVKSTIKNKLILNIMI